MKKNLKALAILSLICILALACTSNIRIARGEVASQTVVSADLTNTCFVTTDGELWIAENYTAPVGDPVLIIYDKCDRSTIYDDTIIYIVHFTEF